MRTMYRWTSETLIAKMLTSRCKMNWELRQHFLAWFTDKSHECETFLIIGRLCKGIAVREALGQAASLSLDLQRYYPAHKIGLVTPRKSTTVNFRLVAEPLCS